MSLCKYCLVCTKPCLDNCKDYVPNEDFDYLKLKWDVEDNNTEMFKDEPSTKGRILSLFSNEELQAELKRRKQ